MSNAAGHVTTAVQLAAMPDDGKRYELVEGVLHVMSPAGRDHGRIAGRLLLRVGNHVEQHSLGETYAAETGFLIGRNPDTVRAPNVSFVARKRLSEFAGFGGFLPLAPAGARLRRGWPHLHDGSNSDCASLHLPFPNDQG